MAAQYSHIGVLAFPFGSHVPPLLNLVRRLAASSSPQDIRFSFFSSAKSNRTIFSGEEFAGIRAYDVWDGTPAGEPFNGSQWEEMKLFLNATPGNFEKAVREAEEESGVKISCLLSEAFLWFAADMAEERKIPWVSFWAAGAFSLSAHLYTDQIWAIIRSISKDEEKQDKTLPSISGMSSVRISDLPREMQPEELETSPLALTIYKMVQKLPKSTAVVLNSFEEMNPTITNDLKSKFKNYLNIGPSILSSPNLSPPNNSNQECLTWLKKQRHGSVVYISFGTVATPPPQEMAALAEALETQGLPFLWSLRDNAKNLLPDGFLDRTNKFGMIVSWAPQLKVLEHPSVGVFVTHCGWNSILESICFGVPLICRPFFGDHGLNSRMVEDVWRIGIRVQGGVFTKDGLIEALNCVMLTEKCRGMRENMDELKKKAQNAVKEDGSSRKNFKALLELLKSSRGVSI